MVVMDRNLFSWNGSTFGQNVTTPVISFLLGHQGLDNCTLELDLSIPIVFGSTERPKRYRRDLDGVGFGGTQLPDGGTNIGWGKDMAMAYHAYDVPAATTVVVMHLSWWDHAAAYMVFFRHGALPTEELYDDMETVMEEEVVLAWHRETGSSRTWIPNIDRRRGKLYVGIQKTGPESILNTAPSTNDYKLQASTVSCLSWEYTPEKWTTDCGVMLELSKSAIRCNCSFSRPKAVIGGSVHPAPNSIDFDKIFENSENLSENGNVFYVVIGEWALYLLFMVIVNVDFQRLLEKIRNDPKALKRKDNLEQLSVLPPDRMPASYLYQITVNTGSMFGAGTSARIGFQVFGSKCKTAVKMLNPRGESLLRGGSYDFIMPVKKPLGHLELLQIWHDSTGRGDAASWFLREIIVKDLQTERTYQFVCYDWLSDARGDCQVQKVLHATTQEQLQSFSTLFRENTNALFYDQHMWTSPIVSPEGSSFSKTERLSCCWAVANAMMVASAMWYRDENDDSITNIVYNLGFVRFRLQELYVSIVTTGLVTPVSMIPLLLFRKEIPAPVTAPGVRRTNSVKRFSRWPKYVAWTIVVVSSVVSSFFVIMYSLDWGREKSEAWLKAFFLSFCLTSVVAETGQILLLALLAAWICNTTPSSKQRTYEIKKDELHLHLLERKAPEKVHSPGAASVQRMKRKNEQRRKFHIVLREYTILFLLVVVLFFISQQDKDPFAFNASQTLSSTLTKGFNSITTPGDFWAWSEKIFLPVLYPSSWYNGWKMKYLDRQFPLHTQAFRIGPPRFIQIRDTADSVELDDTPNGWFVFTGNGSYPCWQFNATSTLVFDSDCISKHSMELPTTLAHATSTLSDLQRTQWIDQYTKWLVLELSLYYPSRKLFSSLQMTVHKTNIGHLSTSATVRTYRLFQYENTSDYGVMIAHILFIVFFLANLIMEAMVIKEEGMKYFFSIWNLISFVSIIGSAVLIWAFGMRYHFASEALKKIVEATGESGIDHFVNFESTSRWDEAFKSVLAMLVFVNTLKLLRVVRFSKTIAKFIALPGAMKSGLIGFSVTSAIAFMAFSSSGMVVFGTHMKAFSNVLHTNYALLDMLLGRFLAKEILEANPYVGPVYFTFFMVFIYIILVNFLVTIICDAIASDASIDDDYDQELADYIWKSLHQIFGIHPPPTSHVKTGEESLTELNANLRMIEESLDDTLDVARSIWPANTSDEPSFNLQGQHAASSFLPTKQLDTYESANEVVKPSTSAMSVVYDQVKSVLETHEADAARLEEVQMESRRRARATVQRKLAARRFIKKAGRGGKRLGTIVEKAEVLLEQHAADTARLEHQHKSNRLLVESKVRQKLAARRMVKDNKK